MVGNLIEQEIITNIQEPTLENTITVDNILYIYSESRNLSFINRFGEKVIKQRRCYKSKDKKGTFSPLDYQLGFMNTKGYSPIMSYLISIMGCEMSYQKGSLHLSDIVGFNVSPTAVQNNTEHIGDKIPENPYDFLPIEKQNEHSDIMIVEVDGTMSPQIKKLDDKSGRESLKAPTEYKECNLIAIEKHIGYKKEKIFGGRFGSREDFREYAREFSLASGQLKTKSGAFIADGALSNWELAESYFPNFVHILDFYHASEHLYSFGEMFKDIPKGKIFSEKCRTMLLNGEIYEVISEMNRMKKNVKGNFLDDAEREIRYFEKNKEKMHYSIYKKSGFPIGSGMIESGCKQVVGKRFKGNGMRWRKKDNTDVLKVRLSYLNGDLYRYFEGNKIKWAA